MTTEGDKLRWFTEVGYGFLPAQDTGLYDLAYWAKYHEYKASPIAEMLMRARVALVEKYAPESRVVDIGIGSGHFIEKRESVLHPTREPFAAAFKSNTYGYDVNPHAIRWLVDRNIWFDPWACDPEGVTMWDTFEHMQRPWELIWKVKHVCFMSIPIFESKEHVLSSKHFKPSEHIWYLSEAALIKWMSILGFACDEVNYMEQELGRDGIGTYVFRREREVDPIDPRKAR